MQRPQRRLPVVLAFPFLAVKERRLKLGSHAPILPTMQPTQDEILPQHPGEARIATRDKQTPPGLSQTYASGDER